MNKIRHFLLFSIAVVTLVGTAQANVLKIATIAPEGSEWMVKHRKAADEIKERTEGRVTLKFYGGGIMGNDKKVLRKIRIGQLQGAAFPTSGLVERYPDINLYGLPFVFRSQAEVDYIRQYFDEELSKGLREAGFVSFGFAGGGFANFMSSEPIRTQEDLEGKKIWVPEGDNLSYNALQSMNLSPVVLPLSDVLTGLQAGLIDVIVTPPSAALLLQWYTKVKYINPLPVSYTLGILALDNRAFDRLNEADQAVLMEVMTATYLELDAINRRDNESAIDALKNNGIQTVESDPEVIPYWYGIAKKTNAELWSKKSVDAGLLDEFLAELDSYRKGGEAVAATAE
ncbi:MAG: TRAP transporter substrate-binding protein DctP [Gammaproteobacteria bacterium]